MRWPRSDFALCSPSAQRTASPTFDFPHPFGPTMPVMPGRIRTTVLSPNDLNPCSAMDSRRMRFFYHGRALTPKRIVPAVGAGGSPGPRCRGSALHALDHVLEEVERFLLVLGERVPLAVAPEPDPLLQVVDGQEMVLPLRVHDHQHLVALEGAHEVRAELALALRVSLADRRADQLREPLSRDRLPEARGRNPHVERAEERLAEPAEIPVLRVSVLGRVAVERPRDEVLGPLRDRLRLAFPLEDLTTHAVDDLALLVHHVVVLEEMLADLVVVRLHALLRRRDRARHELVLDRLALLHPEALHDLLDAL